MCSAGFPDFLWTSDCYVLPFPPLLEWLHLLRWSHPCLTLVYWVWGAENLSFCSRVSESRGNWTWGAASGEPHLCLYDGDDEILDLKLNCKMKWDFGDLGREKGNLYAWYLWPKGRLEWIKDSHEFFASSLIKQCSLHSPLWIWAALWLGFDRHKAAESQPSHKDLWSPCQTEKTWRMNDNKGWERSLAIQLTLRGAREC